MHDDRGAEVDPSQDSRDSDTSAFFVGEFRNPARAIEMTYLSQEPGLLEIIRAIACLPSTTREALSAFLSAAPDAGQIFAARHQGQLVLSSLQTAAPNATAEGRQAG